MATKPAKLKFGKPKRSDHLRFEFLLGSRVPSCENVSGVFGPNTRSSRVMPNRNCISNVAVCVRFTSSLSPLLGMLSPL